MTFTGEIHPYAAVFPMLPDDDLDALAADIKANGLQNPIVLDPDGCLIDGRNRLAACDRAGVEPTFVVHGGDPVAFIVSANLQRRDLSAGMKAYYAVAAFQVETPTTVRELARVAGSSPADIAKARVVARHAPDLFASVLAGDTSPAPAYERAAAIKADLDEAERCRTELEREAPDLLAKGLPLDEAWAAYQARTKEQREAAALRAEKVAKTNRDVNAQIYLFAAYGEYPDRAAELADLWSPDHQPYPVTETTIAHAIDGLNTVLGIIRRHQ